MAQRAERIVQQMVEHVLAVLQEDLPAELRALTRFGPRLPGLLGQLPFISVAAELVAPGTVGLGHTVALKRTLVEGAPVDLGYITGESAACRFTLTLWTVTQTQLSRLRAALDQIAWVQRAHVWEAPPGTLNRTTLRTCRLSEAPASLATPLAPIPRITVVTNNLNLRAGPATNFPLLGQAQNGTQFELLGRNANSTWVQGCCFQGQPVWMANQFVSLSVPLSVVPQSDVPAGPGAVLEAPEDLSHEGDPLPAAPRELGAGIDPGTAILATAATPPMTVWRQDLVFTGYLEATQEPITSAGERIEELRITRHLEQPDGTLDTERTRRFADHEERVDEFPA